MATVHQISSQNLECPICLTLFNQPKLLTCSHTFCKDCLQRISQTQSDKETITCPICRKETPILSGDVDKLQTNVPLSSLVDEVKIKNPTCSVCEMDDKPPAVRYCQDCGEYMCDSCEKGHSFWKPFSTHAVIATSEVLSGKVQVNRRRKCKKHPNDDEECFCTGCREYVCCKCGMLRHSKAGHDIEEAAIHEEKLMENINELKKGVKSKKRTIEKHIKFIETQRNEITSMFRTLNDDIDKTYEEYMQLLSASREALKSQVKQWSKKFEKELQVMEEESRRTISHMNAMEELVTNGMKVPLERDALFAHDTLCENLKSFLGRDDPDNRSPRGVTERILRISFRRYAKVNELFLGELEGCTWDVQGGDVSPPWGVKADVEFPSKNNVACIARAPGGKMAVGLYDGGIHLYSPDGRLKQTVLMNIRICRIGFLSDGRSVVCDILLNKMSLYTPQWKNFDVTFETMGGINGSSGGLTVDRDDNIYVGYWVQRKIQVFTPQGGKAVRSVMFDGFMTQQIFSFHNTGKLILTDGSAVVCLDGKGKKENVLKKEGISPSPAVCRDDSVIVAWVKHEEGLVSIDRYTSDLEHTKETSILTGDVDKLQTNEPLSALVDEVKTKNPTCTVCEMDEKPAAVCYCQDCGKYMCDSCEKGHSIWKPFSTHSVVPMSEVQLSGKIQVNRQRKCKKHPNDEEECFCAGCREYVCCKCGMLRHSQAGHDIEEAAIHEEKLMENIKKLKRGVTLKKTTIENHIEFIETQRNEITSMFRKLNDDIDNTYKECMQLLSSSREELKSEVKQLSEKFEKKLKVMEEESRQTISQMNAMEELVTNGMKVSLEKDALFAHDTLCQNLKELSET
ncbi:uncharacterized protein [Diadema antillarum]|uniref:uncharacterized protein n=1 Tax=Diadema antillarum TaxID=105358 RepID=UPI003A87BA5B